MSKNILKIIEGGIEGNINKIYRYSKILAEEERTKGNENFAKKIDNIINNESVGNPIYLDQFANKPIDKDSRLDIVDVSYKPYVKDLILDRGTKETIDYFIRALNFDSQFIKLGINTSNSLLLYGPPGCGKTSIANMISKQTGLPLITAKLDSLISSLLGDTSKNIRKIFEFAEERPCILFLDEFDAVGKARDDDKEIGELKRVVNSLLQNIDRFNNRNNILIAATNHNNLLDKAIWRRFQTVIEIKKPKEQEIIELVSIYLSPIDYDFKDSNKLEIISTELLGFSHAEIETICINSIKKMVIDDRDILKYGYFAYQVFLEKYNGNDNETIRFLNAMKVSQKSIAELLKISVRQVRNVLIDA